MIIVIEANRYAYSTPTNRQVADGDLVRRAKGFGCPVQHIDGNDVLACYAATRDARNLGMTGAGPTLIVVDTYRRRGHAEHDNQGYVAPGEIDDWATHNDPLDRYVQFLRDGGHGSEADLARPKTEIDAELEADREQAIDEPFPDASTLTQGVYDDGSRPWPEVSTWWRGGPPHREG
jgi:pyruvate dehydrogenase E1 component alpha subunit/2-oxoisovalerate dehydrogenase E1 component alpha subunit